MALKIPSMHGYKRNLAVDRRSLNLNLKHTASALKSEQDLENAKSVATIRFRFFIRHRNTNEYMLTILNTERNFENEIEHINM